MHKVLLTVYEEVIYPHNGKSFLEFNPPWAFLEGGSLHAGPQAYLKGLEIQEKAVSVHLSDIKTQTRQTVQGKLKYLLSHG